MKIDAQESLSAPRVLVVDDTPLSQKKLRKALNAIGIPSESVDDGQTAIDRLSEGGIDLVLLDILMPGLSGFDVLGEIGRDPKLREIPVLVVSSLDANEDIAQALQLGALDFLTKDVAPSIFKARVEGALEKKRLRDIELSYLDDVRKLTEAARLVRAGQTAPQALSLESVGGRDDGLGTLARVFAELAHAVNEREQAARLRINLLQGCLLLLVMGLSWGVVPALSKIMVGPKALAPLGVAAWVAVVTLSIVTVTMIAIGRRPKFTWTSMRFGLVAGLFAGVLPQATLFWVSSHVPGVLLSITLALESLIVFAIAATLRIEKPSIFRLSGLLLGLLAVIVIVLTGEEAGTLGSPLWVLVAVIVPFSYAVESILVAAFPDDTSISPIEFLFFIMLGSSIWGWAGATVTGTVLSPWTAETATLILIVTIGMMSAISNGCYVLTIRKMGAVFASQYAYLVTILGVGWSVLLLGERLTVWVWIALAIVITGMFLVRPKKEARAFSEMLSSTDTPVPSTIGSRA